MPIYNIKNKVLTYLSAQPSSGGGKKVRKNYQINFRSDETGNSQIGEKVSQQSPWRLGFFIWNCPCFGCLNTFDLTRFFAILLVVGIVKGSSPDD